MQKKSLLLSDSCEINEKISLYIPTIGQILEDEQKHYSIITSLISTPLDMMVQLDDAGIDFETIKDYELFIILLNGLKKSNTSLIFKDLNLQNFALCENKENKDIVLYDDINDIIIDKLTYVNIIKAIEKVYLIKKNTSTIGNAAAKKALIKFERRKLQRKQKEEYKPYLENLIVSLVNTSEFKYDFETVMNMNIYTFNKSLLAVQKIKHHNNLMNGCYFGTVDIKKINKDELNWLS